MSLYFIPTGEVAENFARAMVTFIRLKPHGMSFAKYCDEYDPIPGPDEGSIDGAPSDYDRMVFSVWSAVWQRERVLLLKEARGK